MIGYPNARAAPVSCSNVATSFSPTQLELDCRGYTDGTSGSPLLAASGAADRSPAVIGVVGGYEQGGDTPSVSYAVKLAANAKALFERAERAARHSETVSAPRSSGSSGQR